MQPNDTMQQDPNIVASDPQTQETLAINASQAGLMAKLKLLGAANLVGIILVVVIFFLSNSDGAGLETFLYAVIFLPAYAALVCNVIYGRKYLKLCKPQGSSKIFASAIVGLSTVLAVISTPIALAALLVLPVVLSLFVSILTH